VVLLLPVLSAWRRDVAGRLPPSPILSQDVSVRPNQVSLGVLVTAVRRDAVDAAVTVCGVRAKRSDGKPRRM